MSPDLSPPFQFHGLLIACSDVFLTSSFQFGVFLKYLTFLGILKASTNQVEPGEGAYAVFLLPERARQKDASYIKVPRLIHIYIIDISRCII
jgi:hypothetical protein